MNDSVQKQGINSKNQTLPGAVLPSLASLMTIELLVKENDAVYLVHDEPYPGILKWVEYNPDAREMSFIQQDGVTQDLGLDIPEDLNERLKTAKSNMINVVLKKDSRIEDYYIVPFVMTC